MTQHIKPEFEAFTVGGMYYIYTTDGFSERYPWVGEVIIEGESKPMLWAKDGTAWNREDSNLVPKIPDDVYNAGAYAAYPEPVRVDDIYMRRLRDAIKAAVLFDRKHHRK